MHLASDAKTTRYRIIQALKVIDKAFDKETFPLNNANFISDLCRLDLSSGSYLVHIAICDC